MSLVNRATILGSLRTPIVRKVDTPEWGDRGFVYVRQLRASEASEVQHLADASVNGKASEAHALAGWCVLGICDRQGKRLLSQNDIASLLDAPLAVLRRCGEAIMELNGLTEDAESTQKKTSRTSVPLRVPARKRTRVRKCR